MAFLYGVLLIIGITVGGLWCNFTAARYKFTLLPCASLPGGIILAFTGFWEAIYYAAGALLGIIIVVFWDHPKVNEWLKQI
ncbi:hypothetical protein NHN17_23590 [Photobacterium sp. ZSDE20]|uniref:Permease n=1 Tax=Photobacterium pectinilyticum TaxID=2906793 RepID=A0ABT1N8H9_9GAMM|nr:hypothetical protein [Photobacterium sp. ZSDE20]MCQ1061028.1 hypothetical protein [Photobacterium sp. ZSDE20]